MTSLLHPQVQPHYTALNAEPFTAVEIDEHMDCARIWATVEAIRGEMNTAVDYAEGRAEVLEKELGELESNTGFDDLKAAVVRLKSNGFKMKDLRTLYELIGLEL